jgi:hypothetical protein
MNPLALFGGSSGPEAAVEIAAHRVSGAAIETRAGRPVVAVHATEALPAGALVPAISGRNLVDREAVAGALGRVVERLGRPRRVGLIVPDVIAKVSIARFEQVPPRAADLDRLLRWQMRKAAPFPMEDAQLSHTRGLRTEEGQEFVVTVARRDVVEEYETACVAAGAYPGAVDLATFNVANAVLASPGAPEADWLLVNVAADYASIAVLRGGDLVFFRNRGPDSDVTLADLVHQTAMFYEDRLRGDGLARVFLAGAGGGGTTEPDDVEDARRAIESRLSRSVELVDASAAAALTDRIGAGPALLDALAPLVGFLLRDREAA